MFLFHATVHALPGKGAEYEARTIGSADAVARAPGFLRRLLLKDSEHDDVYFYISMWETEDDLERYRSTEYVAGMRERASLGVLTTGVDRVRCELLLDQHGEVK